MSDDIKLPELPEPTDLRRQVCNKCGYVGPLTTTGVHIKPGSDIACNYLGAVMAIGYTAEQVQAYARAAVELNRADEWPSVRDVGRIGDMSRSAHMRVGLDGDNDVYVSVSDERGGGSVEFCTTGSGGGKSPRTYDALIALMVAIEADNAEFSARDWWAVRNGRLTPEPEHGEG